MRRPTEQLFIFFATRNNILRFLHDVDRPVFQFAEQNRDVLSDNANDQKQDRKHKAI